MMLEYNRRHRTSTLLTATPEEDFISDIYGDEFACAS